MPSRLRLPGLRPRLALVRATPFFLTVLLSSLAHAQTPQSAKAPTAADEASAEHGADAAPHRVRAEAWDAWGEARAAGTTLSVVSPRNTSPRDPSMWLMTRLIAGARYLPSGHVKLELEVEALSGFAAGDTSDLGTALTERPFPVARTGTSDLSRVLPRRAAISWTTPFAQIVAGAQTFRWGTGMLANDGAGDLSFGDPWLGNIVARLLLATRPLARSSASALVRDAALFVAGDYVLRDDNASIYDGDRAYGGVFGLRASDGPHVLGALASLRRQVDRKDGLRPDNERARTTALVLDLHGSTGWSLDAAQRLGFEGELASVWGESTRPWSDASWQNGSTVRQLGGVARVRWDHDRAHITAQLEAGYASGDNAPRDDVSRTFTMHTDHSVGIVLFDQVLPLLSARSVDRLADPTLTAVPPPSTRFAINPGAVQNALYGNPVLRYRPIAPLDLRLGYLFAKPAADVIDPYQTAVHGGYATSPGGKVGNRGAYGHELDARAAFSFALPAHAVLRLASEGGVLLPGAAFDGVSSLRTVGGSARPVWLGRAVLSLFW